jgi:hypothetical protein
MELSEARLIARDALTPSRPHALTPSRPHALTPGTTIDDRTVVRAFDTLSDADAEQDRRLAERIEREFPSLIENLDGDGNWIGPVPNGSGWTP